LFRRAEISPERGVTPVAKAKAGKKAGGKKKAGKAGGKKKKK